MFHLFQSQNELLRSPALQNNGINEWFIQSNINVNLGKLKIMYIHTKELIVLKANFKKVRKIFALWSAIHIYIYGNIIFNNLKYVKNTLKNLKNPSFFIVYL